MAGAVINPANSPMVWANDNSVDQTVTTDTNSDGSFDTIEFTYSSSNFSTSVTLAGFDGTSIGTPIFLKIEDGLFIWLLTNGSSLSQGALAMEDNTVYVVLRTTAASTLQKNRRTVAKLASGTASSELYSLDIAGVYSKLATGSFEIDQVFAAADQPVVRSGNSFYYPDDSGGFTLCCSIDSARTIRRTDVDADENDDLWIAVVTDTALTICSASSGLCTDLASIDSSVTIMNFGWSTRTDYDSKTIFVIDLMTLLVSGTTQTYRDYTFKTDGTGMYNTGWGSQTGNPETGSTQTVMGSDPSVLTIVSQMLATEGMAWTGWSTQNLQPQTDTTACSTIGSAKKAAASVYYGSADGSTGTNYLLDAEVIVQSGVSPMLCTMNKTREIYDFEIHPSTKAVFFCAKDGSGYGQVYAYCPTKVTPGKRPDGTEIVQLTEGDEHCNEDKNWKVDVNELAENGSVAGSLVIVDNSTPLMPQIQFIHPATDPRLEDCF